MTELLYINDELSSVFDSQVLSLLKWYQKNKVFSRIVLISGFRGKEQEASIISKVPKGIELFLFPLAPNFPVFNWLNSFRLRSCMAAAGAPNENTVVHLRGEMVALYYSGTGRYFFPQHTVADIRGASLEEIELYYRENPLLKKIKLSNIQKAIAKLNTYPFLSVVSSTLSDYLRKKGIGRSTIEIVPCLSGEGFRFNAQERDRVRKEMGLHDHDLVVVFSSAGSAGWQETRTVQLFEDTGFKIRNLSRRQERVKNVITDFVP